jgi:small-conductance mechanosensitive channel
MNVEAAIAAAGECALIVILAILGATVVRFFGRRARHAIQAREELSYERRQQLVTLVQILRWAANLLIVVGAVLMLLSALGVDITPLLAGVGVVGLAVSLGAQTLIQDVFGGLLILVENQYIVGDVIQTGDISGTVERFTLRVTHVRDIEGRLHVIPNGEVRTVANVTREWSRALVDVGVAYEEDLDHALHVLEGVAEACAQDPDLGPQLLEPPQVLGPLSLGDWAVTVRVMVKTSPGKQWEVARELRKRILAACERENVTLPYPRQELFVHGSEQG